MRGLLAAGLLLGLVGCQTLPPVRDVGWSVRVLDVGEGQAVLVQAGERGLLIDTGHAGQAARLVGRLRALGVRRLDHLVLTHLHPDHASGYFRVMEAYPDAAVHDNAQLLPALPEEQMVRWVATALRAHPRYAPLKARDLLAWAGGRIEILWPHRADGPDWNANSLVLLLRRGPFVGLVMGDAGQGVEAALLKEGTLPRGVDLLVAGHHGAADTARGDFLAHVKPRVAVISVDAGNLRGYPDPDVVRRLIAVSGRLYRTDRDGEVCVSFSASRDLCQAR